MPFELEKSNYEDLKEIPFLCDGKFNNRIQEPFPNSSFFMTIVGPPRSGKTNFLINALTNKDIYKRVFDKVVLVMPRASIASLKDNIFEHLPASQVFHELTPEVGDKLHELRQEFADEEAGNKRARKKNILLILDDVAHELKNRENERMLKEIANNRRHMRVSVILISQYLRSIPKAVRSQITNLVFFTPSNEMDSKIVRDEYVNMKKDDFVDLLNFVFKSAHDFLFVDKYNRTYFKNLQKIIFE